MVQYVLDSVWAGGTTSFNTIMEIENILLDGVSGTGTPLAWTVEPGSHTLTYSAHNLTNFPLNAYGYVLSGTTTYSPWGEGHGATTVTIPANGSYPVTVPLTIGTTSFNGSIYIGHITGDTYQLSIAAGTGGIIGASSTPNGLYTEGTQITAIAQPNSGYIFESWTDAGTGSVVSTSATYVFLMPASNVSILANFTQLPPDEYSVTLTQPPSGYIEQSGDGGYLPGDPVTITANPPLGYSFKQWTGAFQGITQNPYTFNMPGSDITIGVEWQQGGQQGVNWMLIGAAIGGIALIGLAVAFTRRQPAPRPLRR